jgi:hypothetical protein
MTFKATVVILGACLKSRGTGASPVQLAAPERLFPPLQEAAGRRECMGEAPVPRYAAS